MGSAYIISSNEDYQYLISRQIDNEEIYACSYILFHKLKKNGIRYLFNQTKIEISSEMMDFLAHNWYREKGKDIFYRDSFSFAPVITRTVLSSFSNDVIKFCNLKELSKDFDSLYLPKKIKNSFTRILNYLDISCSHYESGDSNILSDYKCLQNRAQITKISYKKTIFSSALFLLDILMFKTKRNKILVWNESSYRPGFLARNDVLLSNDRNFLKGFFFPYIFKKKKKINNNIFDSFNFSVDSLTTKMINQGFHWEKEFSEIFIKNVKEVYIASYRQIQRTKDSISKAFKIYKPRKIILPGEVYYEYCIALQVAKQFNIESILFLDGVQMVFEGSLMYKDFNGKKNLFDKYFVFSKENFNLLRNYHQIPKDSLLKVRSPFSNIEFKQKGLKYDAIILAIMPNQIYPQSSFDQRHKITYDLAKRLVDLGLKNIAIKIKQGINENLEIENYANLIDENHKKDIRIITGKLSDFFGQSKIFISQFSSAIIELVANNEKVIIFNTHEIGLPNKAIESCELIDDKNLFNCSKLIKDISPVNPKNIHFYENDIANFNFDF